MRAAPDPADQRTGGPAMLILVLAFLIGVLIGLRLDDWISRIEGD